MPAPHRRELLPLLDEYEDPTSPGTKKLPALRDTYGVPFTQTRSRISHQRPNSTFRFSQKVWRFACDV